MKQKIGKKTYDTDASEVVCSTVRGTWGDPAGYEEKLYRTDDGCYFLWGYGGETSPYPTEKITRLARAKVDEYLSRHQG
ncbi:MAG: hypothetical protein J6125_03385 [Clostridia bacterium]|nr:hypothetical protein [Clostridia bacterium]